MLDLCGSLLSTGQVLRMEDWESCSALNHPTHPVVTGINSHNKRIFLFIYYIQIPFKGFCKDQCWNILYRCKSLYIFMKAFALWLCFSLMAMFFTTSMLLLSGVDRAMLHSPSGIISFISKNFQILANAFEWTNSTYIRGIFLQI